MKLSDAIMLNGMTKPQGYGDESVASLDAPCVIGGALQAIGKQHTESLSPNYQELQYAWPWLNAYVDCPHCRRNAGFIHVIWHLNDVHRWTRQQIAAWVAAVEPDMPTEAEITAEEALCLTQK